MTLRASLRRLYRRLKYRPGRTLLVGRAYDDFVEILVVENRLATAGTLVYRERAVSPFEGEPRPFGPPHEDTVPAMLRRLASD